MRTDDQVRQTQNRRWPSDLITLDRAQPYSIESEEAVLGSILIDPEQLVRVKPILHFDDFYIVRNGWVYSAILGLNDRGIAIDFVTVCEELDRRSQLSEAGGPAHISHLVNVVPTSLHAEGYARLVEAASIRRRMLNAAGELARLAFDEDGDIDAQLGQAMKSVQSIARANSRTMPVDEAARLLFEELAEWSQNKLPPGAVRGTSCGLRAIDLLIGGFEPNLLYILAGRPGMGKSALGFQIGFNMARDGRRVLLFSIEMSQRKVLRRWLAMLTGISSDDLQRGDIPDDKWSIVVQTHGTISDLPITINDSTRITTAQIEADVARYRPDLVVVDHLRLIGDALIRGENETARIGRVSWALKQIAREYHIPVLCLCQLNRSLETRGDKRPILPDLRQSGEIEENADDVLMLYRDDMYDEATVRPGIAEVWGRKLRDGDANSMAELYYRKSITTFFDIERRQTPIVTGDLNDLSRAMRRGDE